MLRGKLLFWRVQYQRSYCITKPISQDFQIVLCKRGLFIIIVSLSVEGLLLVCDVSIVQHYNVCKLIEYQLNKISHGCCADRQAGKYRCALRSISVDKY